MLDSDDISEILFHELTHAAHYAKVGGDWWHDFVNSELIEGANNDGTNWDTYGHGDTERSAIIALGESFAYHYGRILADQKYTVGINFFSSRQFEQSLVYENNNPVVGLSSHINLIEDFSPQRTNDPYFWIPQGLYYDLFDGRNEFVPVLDQVDGYNDTQFFNALDVDITSLPQYRHRLLAENGNNLAPQVIDLFLRYGY